jgi:hypothetical protein
MEVETTVNLMIPVSHRFDRNSISFSCELEIPIKSMFFLQLLEKESLLPQLKSHQVFPCFLLIIRGL